MAAIAKREHEEITERKKSLAGLMSNIAEIGGANVERKIGKASVRDAIIGTGVAIDKMLALTGQTPAVQIANIVLPTEEERAERRALHDKLDGGPSLGTRRGRASQPKPRRAPSVFSSRDFISLAVADRRVIPIRG